MTSFLLGKYPRLMKYKPGGTYPGCVVAQEEAGSGTIIYIPVPPSGGNQNLTLFERVTVTNSELDPFTGKVTLVAGADPTIS